MTNIDKQIEASRYDARSFELLNNFNVKLQKTGSEAIDLSLRQPYIVYENTIRKLIKCGEKVLEIGSGSGMHTKVLLETGAYVTASDISKFSLELLKKRIDSFNMSDRLTCSVGDMENLPFPDFFFDAVVCAGSLSYGDPTIVNNEIARVLKPGGVFIAVDSLSSNPIYNLNRYIHFLRKERSNSTLKRMPNFKRLNDFRNFFNTVEIQYFGSIVWLVPFLKCIFGAPIAASIVNWVDKTIRVKKSAFKFLLVAKNKN